jgi:hypothetical protein
MFIKVEENIVIHSSKKEEARIQEIFGDIKGVVRR